MNTRLAIIAGFTLAVVLLSAGVGSGQAAAPEAALEAEAASGAEAAAAGERALRTRLAATYPDVTRWDIAPLRPMAGSRPLASASAERWSAQITRLGVRSAVWIAPAPVPATAVAPAAATGARGELLWYSVAGYGPAVVATRRIAPQSALDSQDGELVSADLVAAACAALDSPQALEGMRARITLRAGEVICAGAIEERPPVARGEEVTVRYASGPVVLTARAVAQGDGRMGKSVMVRNTASGDIFPAKVSGKAEVSVND